MKFPRPRLSIRMMIALVALAAVLFWGWMTYLDPVRLWKEAIRDKYDMMRRYEGIDNAVSGRVPRITPDLAIAEFVGILGDQSVDSSVRWTAAEGLGKFHGKARAAIPALIAASRDESPSVRTTALLMIRRILGDRPEDDPIKRDAVGALGVALKDPDRRVRRMSACCLGWMGEGEIAIPTLRASLKEPDLSYMDRIQILNALQRSGPKAAEALPEVLEMANIDSIDEGNRGGENGRRGNAQVQMDAARFLHAYGQTGRAVEILQRLAKDRDPVIAKDAEKILGSIQSTQAPAGSETSR
jgi:HEAT repeat protein